MYKRTSPSIANSPRKNKKICIDAYTLEGADESSYADISDDVEYAEIIFYLATLKYDFPYFLNISFTHTEIPREDWQSATSFTGTNIDGKNNVIEISEAKNIANLLTTDDGCYQVFYVPQLGDPDESYDNDVEHTLLGLTYHNLLPTSTDCIMIDNSRDNANDDFRGTTNNNLVLAHELLHVLSILNDTCIEDYYSDDPDNEIKSEAIRQGANQEGNLMNVPSHYGENISINQYAYINWDQIEDE